MSAYRSEPDDSENGSCQEKVLLGIAQGEHLIRTSLWQVAWEAGPFPTMGGYPTRWVTLLSILRYFNDRAAPVSDAFLLL